jgi:cell division protein ZipA
MNSNSEHSIQDFIIIHVVAKPGEHFAAYDLLQAISATGMQFGAMNIFHYYSPSSMDKKPLFSLASATEPGEFDLNNMGNFSCNGLTLFMNVNQVPNQMKAFTLMVDAAEQLAEGLQGKMLTSKQEPWSHDTTRRYLDMM